MYWLREIAGWLLVLLGLLMLFAVYVFLQPDPDNNGYPHIFEAFIFMIPSVFVFLGGIQLLKVAIAARLCAQADERLYPAPPPGDGPRPAGLPRRREPGA